MQWTVCVFISFSLISFFLLFLIIVVFVSFCHFKGYLGFLRDTKRLSPSELNNCSLFENDEYIQDYLNFLDVSADFSITVKIVLWRCDERVILMNSSNFGAACANFASSSNWSLTSICTTSLYLHFSILYRKKKDSSQELLHFTLGDCSMS